MDAKENNSLDELRDVIEELVIPAKAGIHFEPELQTGFRITSRYRAVRNDDLGFLRVLRG